MKTETRMKTVGAWKRVSKECWGCKVRRKGLTLFPPILAPTKAGAVLTNKGKEISSSAYCIKLLQLLGPDINLLP